MPALHNLEDGTPADDDLIQRSLAGSEPAFRMLVERYESTVAGVVVGMLGRGDEADDVGQEVFVRFYRSMARFRGDAALGTYLTRIAINQSLKALRKRERWFERFLSRDAQDAPLDGVADSDPAADLQGSELAERLQGVLARLSPEHRAVVVLRVMEGFTTRETADMLGVPEGTVMSRLKRGLEKMRAMIEMEKLDL